MSCSPAYLHNSETKTAYTHQTDIAAPSSASFFPFFARCCLLLSRRWVQVATTLHYSREHSTLSVFMHLRSQQQHPSICQNRHNRQCWCRCRGCRRTAAHASLSQNNDNCLNYLVSKPHGRTEHTDDRLGASCYSANMKRTRVIIAHPPPYKYISTIIRHFSK